MLANLSVKYIGENPPVGFLVLSGVPNSLQLVFCNRVKHCFYKHDFYAVVLQ